MIARRKTVYSAAWWMNIKTFFVFPFISHSRQMCSISYFNRNYPFGGQSNSRHHKCSDGECHIVANASLIIVNLGFIVSPTRDTAKTRTTSNTHVCIEFFFSFCGCATRHTREWKNAQTASISSIPIRNCIITSHDIKVLEPVHIQLRFIQYVFNKWHFFSSAGSERIFVDGNKISFGTSKCYFSNDQNHRHQHHRRVRLVRESGSSHQNE